MEDAHIADTKFAPGQSLFGVFDGHGGQEVARFTEKHYPEVLKSQKDFTSGENILEGLRRSFLGLDEVLDCETGMKEIAGYKREKPPAKSPLMKILQETMKNKGGNEI